jgi:hypothetical protein
MRIFALALTQTMRTIRNCFVSFGIVAACATFHALAVDLTSAYDEQELRFWQPRYSATTIQLLRALMGQIPGQPAAFTPAQQQQLSKVQLRFPLPSEQIGTEAQFRGDPLMFYSRVDLPEVTLPVLSLKFFSDVCLAYDWLNGNGYESASPTIYMKLVKYNPPTRFPQGKYPPLLRAVGIPDDARKDTALEERYYFTFNHFRTFILLHELGHIYHRDVAGGPDSQKHEVDADLFALETLRRLEAPPLGAVLYFTAAANVQLNRADFPTEAAWKEYLSKLSHPANEVRLQQASDYVRRNARAFAGGANPTPDEMADVQESADILSNLAKLVSDPEFPMGPPKSTLVDLSPLELHKRKK